jgi:hypothetical protein
VRIDRVGTSKAPAAPAPAPAATPVEEASASFSSSAVAAALALRPLQPKERRGGVTPDGQQDPKKAALESIDDIAARASLNIVSEKEPREDRQT